MRIRTSNKIVQFDLNTERIDRRFHIAQVHLDNRVLRDSNHFAPESSGVLVSSSIYHTVPGSGTIEYHTPYAHYQYEGRVMVGKNSGRPWARRGEPKVYNGNHLKYQKKSARAKWFEEAKKRYFRFWKKGVEEDLHG